MDFFGYSYGEAALFGTLAAAVLGFLCSLPRFWLERRSDETAKWQPLPFTLGFTIFWPAIICLLPFFVFDNVLSRAARAERGWAARLVDAPGYQFAGRLVFGLGFGLMGCYVIGFFYF